MKRIFVFIPLAFLAGLGIGSFTRGAYPGMLQRRTHAADLAGIEKLHQKDIAVTLSGDPKGLIDIWTEDAVRLDPGNAVADLGKPAIQDRNEKVRAQYPDFTVLSYSPEYKNIQIADGLACEWGEIEAKYKLSPESPPASVHGKGLYVLRRQSDGSWKFAVIIRP